MSVLDHALHGVAYLALKALPLQRAHSLIMQLGSRLPQREHSEVMTGRGVRLRGGTCLSRSLAVSARVPNSEVVIGVCPPQSFGAHAWVEVGSKVIVNMEPHGAEIARLRRQP